MLERGAYRDLLDHYYARDGALAADHLTLCRICGAVSPDEQEAIRRVSTLYFTQDGMNLRNARADLEIEERRRTMQVRENRAIAGATARWSRKDASSNASSNANGNAGSNAHITYNKEHKTLRVVSDTEFGHFWDSWPRSQRKVAKSACLQVWKSKGLGAVSAQIVAHVEAMKGTEQWKRGYEPAPLTYLRQRRWEDETAEPEYRGNVL